MLEKKKITFIIDSSFVNNINGNEILGRNKFNKNKNCNKISIICDDDGIPLNCIIDRGNIHDSKFFIHHVESIKNNMNLNNLFNIHDFKSKIFLADGAYDSKFIVNYLKNNKFTSIIPKNKRNSKHIKIDKFNMEQKKIYAKRIRIEHLFSRLKKYRRLNNRYDKNYKRFCGTIYFCIICFLLNK